MTLVSTRTSMGGPDILDLFFLVLVVIAAYMGGGRDAGDHSDRIERTHHSKGTCAVGGLGSW